MHNNLECPKCGGPLEDEREEVDIGVGIQTFHIGYLCPIHGPVVSVCYGCGIPKLSGYACQAWCPDKSWPEKAP